MTSVTSIPQELNFVSFQIRDVIFKHLRISRDVSILRVKRSSNGPEVRGCKPVTVYFEKWQDKDEILRKSSMLRGANIYISEDFSKRVRDQVKSNLDFFEIFLANFWNFLKFSISIIKF